MKVLMLGWEFPPFISGGLGTACYGLTRGLTQRGVEVLFVLPRVRDPQRRSHVRILSAAQTPIPHRREAAERALPRMRRLHIRTVNALLRPYMDDLEYARTLVEIEKRLPPADDAAATVLDISGEYGRNLMAEVTRYSLAVEQIALAETFDIIHAHDWMTVPAAIRAQAVTGKPFVFHVHAVEFDRSGENINPDVYAIEKLGMESAARVIAVSYYTRNRILSRYGIAPDKVTVAHNAVSRQHAEEVYHLERKKTGKTVLFLGRITFQKGPDYFVEAAARVLKKMPDVTFVMAGTGDMLTRMITRVAQLRIGRQFHFTGFLHGADVERMYAQSDLYVMPSVSEPFGISPLEAMLYDVPVIVSKHSGVSEVLTHALKVDFWDVQEIANKILAALNYPALTREMMRNARRELRALHWEAVADRIIALYQSLLG